MNNNQTYKPKSPWKPVRLIPIAGLKKLLELGVEMVEFDVRSTADGGLVVRREEDICGRRLAEHTYLELARIGPPPARLLDFLAIAGGKLALDVEIKEPGYEITVLNAVLEAQPQRR